MLQAVPEGTKDAVSTVTVEGLLKAHELESFDFVKMDIEGERVSAACHAKAARRSESTQSTSITNDFHKHDCQLALIFPMLSTQQRSILST